MGSLPLLNRLHPRRHLEPDARIELVALPLGRLLEVFLALAHLLPLELLGIRTRRALGRGRGRGGACSAVDRDVRRALHPQVGGHLVMRRRAGPVVLQVALEQSPVVLEDLALQELLRLVVSAQGAENRSPEQRQDRLLVETLSVPVLVGVAIGPRKLPQRLLQLLRRHPAVPVPEEDHLLHGINANGINQVDLPLHGASFPFGDLARHKHIERQLPCHESLLARLRRRLAKELRRLVSMLLRKLRITVAVISIQRKVRCPGDIVIQGSRPGVEFDTLDHS